MYDLEMDILIIVIHMFLSFLTSAYDGSTFFRASETKQSCGLHDNCNDNLIFIGISYYLTIDA